MIKNNKFMIVFAISLLAVALLSGCSGGAEGEAELNGENGSSSNQAVEDNTTDQVNGNDEQAVNNDTSDQAKAQTPGTTNGILKAIDSEMVTITTEDGEDLVLKLANESKILVSESPSTLNQLATKIGSEIRAEYDAETKTITSISIQE